MAKKVYCENCGQQLEESDKFCSSCGYKRELDETPVEENRPICEKNHERSSANIALIFFITGIFLVVWPFISKADMMGFGYASIFFGGFVSICAFIFFMIFNKRANVMEKMINNENLLARWTLSSSQKEKLNEEEISNAKMARVGSSVLGGIFVIIGFVMFLADTDENWLFFAMMIGVGLFITLTVRLATAVRLRRLKGKRKDIVISLEGVYFENLLYCWDGVLNKLESVMLDPDDEKVLLFVFKQLHGRYLRRYRCVLQIPIPTNKKDEAAKIIDAFKLPPTDDIVQYVKNMVRDE